MAAGLGAGCGDDGGPSDVVLTPGQAQLVGGGVADQATNLVEAFTLDGLGESPIEKAVARAPVEPRLRRLLFVTLAAGEDCAVFSDTTDSDADGVPDDLVVTFSSPACTTFGDSGTAIASGSFRVTDPGLDPGFTIAYSNVRLRFESATSDDYLDFRLNGTQGVATTTTSADLHEFLDLTVAARAGTQVANVTLQDNWTASFTADTGGTYDVRAPLPDGSISITGSSAWSGSGINASLGVATLEPLTYQATCTNEPVFESGQLRALIIGNRGGAFVRVQFIGCGQEPIVTLVGQPSS